MTEKNPVFIISLQVYNYCTPKCFNKMRFMRDNFMFERKIIRENYLQHTASHPRLSKLSVNQLVKRK